MRFNYGTKRSLNLIQENLVEEWQEDNWSKDPEKTKSNVSQGVDTFVGEFSTKDSVDTDFFKLLRVGLTAPLKVVSKVTDFSTNPFLSMMGAIRDFSKNEQDTFYDKLIDKGIAILDEDDRDGPYYANVRDFMILGGMPVDDIDKLFDNDKVAFKKEFEKTFKTLFKFGLGEGNRLTARAPADAFRKRITGQEIDDKKSAAVKKYPLYSTILPGQGQFLFLKDFKESGKELPENYTEEMQKYSTEFNKQLIPTTKDSFLSFVEKQKVYFTKQDETIKIVNERFKKLTNKLATYPVDGITPDVELTKFKKTKLNELSKKASGDDNVTYPKYIRDVLDEIQDIIEDNIYPAYNTDKQQARKEFQKLVELSWTEIFKLKGKASLLEKVKESKATIETTGDLVNQMNALGIKVSVDKFDITSEDLDINNINSYYNIEQNVFTNITGYYDSTLTSYKNETDETKKKDIETKLFDFESKLKANVIQGSAELATIDSQLSKTIRQILSDITNNLNKIQADPEVRDSIVISGILGDYYLLTYFETILGSDSIADQLPDEVQNEITEAYEKLESTIDKKLESANIDPNSITSAAANAPVVSDAKGFMKEIIELLDDGDLKTNLQNLKLEARMILSDEDNSKEKLKNAITKVMAKFKVNIKGNVDIDTIVESIINAPEEFEKVISDSYEFTQKQPSTSPKVESPKTNEPRPAPEGEGTGVTFKPDTSDGLKTKTSFEFEKEDFENAEIFNKIWQLVGNFIVSDIVPEISLSTGAIQNHQPIKDAISKLNTNIIFEVMPGLKTVNSATFTTLTKNLNKIKDLIEQFKVSSVKTKYDDILWEIVQLGTNLDVYLQQVMEQMELSPLAGQYNLEEKFKTDFAEDEEVTNETRKENSKKNKKILKQEKDEVFVSSTGIVIDPSDPRYPKGRGEAE